MRRPIEQQAVRRVEVRKSLLVQNQAHDTLRRDPVDRPTLPLAVSRVAYIESAGLHIDGQVVEEQRGCGKRRGRGEDRRLALYIDPPDPILVGHEEPLLMSDQPLRVIETRGERHDLALFDLQNGAVT